MKTVLLLTLAAAASAETQGSPLSDHVRSLKKKRVESYSTYIYKVLKQVHPSKSNGNRKLSGEMESMLCDAFNEELPVEELEAANSEQGVVCSEFGCNDQFDLVANCGIEEEVCQDQFCVSNSQFELSMGIDPFAKNTVSLDECFTYNSPDYMAGMGRGCSSITATIDNGAMMDDVMSGQLDVEAMTEDEMAAKVLDYFEITECSLDFEDGTQCSCRTCNGGKGFEVTCTNDLVSEKCTNFDSSLTDVDTLAGGEDGTPSVAVMKLLPASDVTASDAVDYSGAEDYDDAVGFFADLWNEEHADTSPASSRNVGDAGFAVAALASVAAHALSKDAGRHEFVLMKCLGLT